MKPPTSFELRLAAHALRWAQFGYKEFERQAAIGHVRLWLIEQAGLPQAAHVLAEDLELYAITTGEFYSTHIKAAELRSPRHRWRHWLRVTVLDRYRREVRPAWVMPIEICRAARALQHYYEICVTEQEDQEAR